MKPMTIASLVGTLSLSSLAWAQPLPPVGSPTPSDSTLPAPPPDLPPPPSGAPPPPDEPASPPPETPPPAPAEPDSGPEVEGLGESYGEPQPTGMETDAKTSERSPFRRAGQAILGFEHLVGVYSTSVTFKRAPEPQGQGGGNFGSSSSIETTESTLRFSAFGSEGAGAFTAPKLALDVLLGPRVTFGGSLYFYSTTTTVEGGVTGETTLSGFGINPRLGIALGEKPIVWLRAGIAYATASTPDSSAEDDVNDETSISNTALSLEATVVFMSASGLGFGVGPSLYVPLSSSLEIGGSEPAGSEVSTFSWMISASGYFAP